MNKTVLGTIVGTALLGLAKSKLGQKSQTKHCFISWSGGMDSTALVVKKLSEGYTVHAVSFEYGQKHSIELERLQQNIQYFKENGIFVEHLLIKLEREYTTDISSNSRERSSSLLKGGEAVPQGFYEQENMKSTVVSNRNAIFSSLLYAEAHQFATTNNTQVEISLGVHSGDHAIYPDCTPKFYEELYKAFSTGNWNSDLVVLSLPYIKDDKAIILRDALKACEKLGLDFDTVFANTNTSYDPDEYGRSSGKTGADVERILAFHQIGRKDPVPYVMGWEKSLEFALQKEAAFNRNKKGKSK